MQSCAVVARGGEDIMLADIGEVEVMSAGYREYFNAKSSSEIADYLVNNSGKSFDYSEYLMKR